MELKELLIERDIREIEIEYNKAKEELSNDIEIRIALQKLEKFIKEYGDYIVKANVSNTRLSELQKNITKFIDFLQTRIARVRNVKVVSKEKIDDLENFLSELIALFEKQKKEQTKLYRGQRK